MTAGELYHILLEINCPEHYQDIKKMFPEHQWSDVAYLMKIAHRKGEYDKNNTLAQRLNKVLDELTNWTNVNVDKRTN